VALALGGSFCEQAMTSPPATAATYTGTAATGGWKYANSTGGDPLSGTPITLGTTSASSSSAATFDIDDQSVYWSNPNAIGTFVISGDPMTNQNMVPIGFTGGGGGFNPTTLSAGDTLSTIAVDANPNNDRNGGDTYLYAWSWNGVNSVNTTENGGPLTSYTFPVFRWKSGDPNGTFCMVPLPTYFPSSPTVNQYWSGGEVDQANGKIYFGGGEATGINTTYNMMIYDPSDYSYNFSGVIQPATAADNIFGNTTAPASGSGYVSSDMAIDANGNAYVLVQSSGSGQTYNGVTYTGTNTWLVKIVPSQIDGQAWKYSIVTHLAAAPGANVSSFLTTGGLWGMSFYNGMLYASSTSYGNTVLQINPVSGLVSYLPGATSATSNHYTASGVASTLRDMASGQGPMIIQGTVYGDVNGNGTLDSGDSGLSGQTVALYLEDASDMWVYQGSQLTNASGAYSFLLGAAGNYIVRLVQPTMSSAPAWQTYGTGSQGDNKVTAICSNGNITSGDGLCYGNLAFPASDPNLPGSSGIGVATIDKDTIPMFSTVEMKTSRSVATADFGVSLFPDATQSSFATDKTATGVHQPITATATVLDTAGQPMAGRIVTFANASDPQTTITGEHSTKTCTTDSSGQCSVTITSGTVGTYTDELSATINVAGADVSIDVPKTVQFIPGEPAHEQCPDPFHPGEFVDGTSVLANPDSLAVDDTSAILAIVSDADCNRIPDVSIDLTLSGSPGDTATLADVSGAKTDDNGEVSANLTDSEPETVRVTGTMPDQPTGQQSMGYADVTFQLGVLSHLKSTFTVSPVTNPADATQTGWPSVDGGTYTAKLTAKDEGSHALIDLDTDDVTFTASDPAVTVSAVTSNGDGTYTATITSTKASASLTLIAQYQSVEVGDTLPIPFKAGAPASFTFAVSPIANPSDTTHVNWPSAGVGHYTGTLTASDDQGNPVSGIAASDIDFAASDPAVTVDTVTDYGDGTYTVTYRSTLASSTLTATASCDGWTSTAMPIPFTTGDPATLTFEIIPEADSTDITQANWQSIDGGHYTGKLTVLDANSNPVPGLDSDLIDFTASNPAVTVSAVSDHGDGTYTVQYTSTLASSALTASLEYDGTAVGTALPIPFTTGAPATMTFTVDPVADLGDETTWQNTDDGFYTGTFQVADSGNNPLAALNRNDMSFTASSSLVSVSTISNNHDGSYSVTYTAAKASDIYTASMTYQGTQVGTALPIPFLAGAPVPGPITCPDPSDQGTGVYVSPSSLTVNTTSTVTALVTDANCNPVADIPVSLDVTAGHGQLGTPSGAKTDADGQVTAPLTDSVAEDTTVTGAMTIASMTPAQQPMGDAVVTFTPGDAKPGPFTCPDPDDSSGTIPGTGVYAAASSSSVDGSVDVWGLVTDESCNPLSGYTVTLTADSQTAILTSLTSTHGQSVSGVTDQDGKVPATLSDSKPEDVNVTGSVLVGTTPAPMGQVKVTFTTGQVKPGPFTCPDPDDPGLTIPGTSVTADSPVGIVGTSNVTVLVTDQFCNPIAGVDVKLTKSGSAALALIGPAVTDENGQVKATLTDPTPETVTVDASMEYGEVGSASVLFLTAGTPRILSPAENALTNHHPVVSGDNGEPGETITVVSDAADGTHLELCTAIVADDGTWWCKPIVDMPDGGNVLSATQVDGNGASSPSEPVDITVRSLTIKIVYKTLAIGDDETVIGYNFMPGEQVHLTLQSGNKDGGYGYADNNGVVSFTFTVTGAYEIGKHTATLTGEDSGEVSGVFQVMRAEAPTGGALAPAGSAAGILAMMAVMAGLGLAWLSRRRQVGLGPEISRV